MASTLFVQMASRMQRRAMIDLMDELYIETRKRAGIKFIELPASQLPLSALPQIPPHAVPPIVPAQLMRVGHPAS
jgi:ABC-type dipeptide/oligopeptide/nickel transport system permease component